MSRIMDDMRQEVMHEEAVRISKRILEPDSPNKKNEIEIKQQMLKIIPQLKNLGNTGNR